MTRSKPPEARIAECLSMLGELGVQIDATRGDDAVECLHAGLKELLQSRRSRPRLSYSLAVQLQAGLVGVLGRLTGRVNDSGSLGEQNRSLKAIQRALEQAADARQFAGDQLVPQERGFSGDELVSGWKELFSHESPGIEFSVSRAAKVEVVGDLRRLSQVGILAISHFAERTNCPGFRVVVDMGLGDREGRAGLDLRLMSVRNGSSVGSGKVSRLSRANEQAMTRLIRRLVVELGGQFEYDGPLTRVHIECPVQLADLVSQPDSELDRSEPKSPADNQSPMQVRKAKSVLTASLGKRGDLRALIVEDNPINARVLGGLIAKLGLKYEVADDGKMGLARAKADCFDVILMDCDMPVMDGFEATRRIRQLGGSAARTPIIAVTAHAESEDRERCLGAGMDDYVSKPIRKDLLVGALTRHVPGFARMTARAAA